MEIPQVKVNDIIKIGNTLISPKAQVIQVYSEKEKEHGLSGDIEVIYYQNGIKYVREDAFWKGEYWELKGGGRQMHEGEYPELKKNEL